MRTDKLEILALIIFSILSLYFIFLDYSLWWDELYSITTVSMTLSEFWQKTILIDVHPPLYQIILKLWLTIFHDNPVNARLLSFLFVFLSIIAIFLNKQTLEKTTKGYLYLYICMWPIIFYSNEVRSYSLALFLSTLLFINYLKYGPRLSKSSATLMLLLSLTHYFGLVLSGLYLLALMIRSEITKREFLFAILVGFSMLVFPMLHFYLGDLTNKAGGNFWITSTPFDAITKVLSLIIPFTLVFKQLNLNITIHPLIFYGCFLFLALMFKRNRTNLSVLIFFLFYVTTIGIIDLHSPISTTRNFIVLIPLLAYLISQFLKTLPKPYNNLLLILIITPMLTISLLKIVYKARPIEANKEAAQYIDTIPQEVFFVPPQNSSFQFWQKAMYNYYPKSKVTGKQISESEEGNIFIAIHINDEQEQEFLSNCFSKLKSFDKSTVLFIKKDCSKG